MEITNTGKVESLTYLQRVNKDNKEEQDERTSENIVKSREWQAQLNGIKAMEADYNVIKTQEIIQASEDFLELYGVGGTIDTSA